MTTLRVPVSAFFALFTLSGFAGLIYQSIWSHYLKLFLGHAAYAQTLVLAIFMGGMAIGSWLVGRSSHRIRNLLAGYALAELLIGVLALAFHRVFLGATGWAFDSVIPAMSPGAIDAFKWTLASALILPASILLGTTFPLMSAGILRAWPDTGGRALAMLYFTNSFGAAVGVLASGFFMIDRFGLPGTIFVAGVANIVLGLVVLALARDLGSAELPPAAPAPAAESAPGAASSLVRLMLVLAAATGAASFIYEVTWIRMLSMGLGASTHAFEVMLAAFILGMALGAFWFRNRIAGLRNDVGVLAGLLFGKAAFAVYAVWVYGSVLTIVQWTLGAVARSDGGYTLATLAALASSILVMFPAAFCAGMTLPLATHVLTRRGAGEGAIGKVYGANTAGCIVGAILATHFGMEALGLKGLTGLGALLDFGVGALVLLATAPRERRARLAGVSAVVLVALGASLAATQLDRLRMSSAIFRTGIFYDPRDSKVVFYEDGKTATVAVVERARILSIMTNGKPDASIDFDPARRVSPDESTTTLVGVLPLALKPDAKRIANIGFGSGLTTHALLASPGIERLDTIEIERQMVQGAKAFMPRNRRAFEDPRGRVHFEDAKTYFAAHGEKYDIIVSEPSNPWVSGVATLFSEEWYGNVKRYLRDDGLFVQWVQAYEIDSGLLSTVFNALGKHFGDYTIYTADGVDLIVIATPGARLPVLQDKVFAFPGLREELAYLGYRELGDLEILRLAGRRAIEPFFATLGYPANSDYYPILDQRAARARFGNATARELLTLREELVPVMPLLDGPTRTRVERIASMGPNRSARLEAVVTGAEGLGVAITGSASGVRVLPRPAMEGALLVHGLAADCRGAEAVWMDKLSDVARGAMALRPADVAPLFDFARASRCAKSLGEPDQLRLALLQAINANDAPALVAISDKALASLPPERGGWRADYVMAGMAGHLAAGRRAEALALVERELARLTPADRTRLPLRLLVGHAAPGMAKTPER